MINTTNLSVSENVVAKKVAQRLTIGTVNLIRLEKNIVYVEDLELEMKTITNRSRMTTVIIVANCTDLTKSVLQVQVVD